MLRPRKFHVPEGYDEGLFFAQLSDHHAIRKGRHRYRRVVIYDTFDWRLFNRSLVLYESGRRLHLRKLYEDADICSAQMTVPPVFIGDFPDSELKELVEPVIKMRALIKLVEVSSRKAPYRIVDQHEKTVARVEHEEIFLSRDRDRPAIATFLWLKPVGGYLGYAREMGERLTQGGFTEKEGGDIFFTALEGADRKPGDYTTKLDVRLTPDMRPDQAAKIILRSLLHVMRVNEAHIAKDLDTEFLHDFRVAVRRTRSALRQLKSVFPPEANRRFRKDFSFVGKLSNQLRDLDVYLLNEGTYKAMLPDGLRGDIEPLFAHLREKRSRALREVTRGLETETYRQILKGWDDFLREPPQGSPESPHTGPYVIDVARKRIYKKYRRIVKDGNAILENTQDELLHRLRIQCKELRYLLEFFSSLFPPKKTSALIEQLKKLQDNLGDFNDFCVQEEYLLKVADELAVTDLPAKKTLVAIGSLVGTLDRKRQAAKGKFSKTFQAFASSENSATFRELFSGKKRKSEP